MRYFVLAISLCIAASSLDAKTVRTKAKTGNQATTHKPHKVKQKTGKTQKVRHSRAS
jgi:hypothetical protein